MSFRVLIVDDSKLARMAVGKLLRTLRPDWTLVEAANVEEGLASVKANAIDVTLLDYNMPGRDGLSLAAELRELKPGMPVALISANNQTEIVTQAQELGAAFLSKPLTQQVLGTFLADAVTRLEAGGQ
jgi:CheY-like chemotaxis protein